MAKKATTGIRKKSDVAEKQPSLLSFGAPAPKKPGKSAEKPVIKPAASENAGKSESSQEKASANVVPEKAIKPSGEPEKTAPHRHLMPVPMDERVSRPSILKPAAIQKPVEKPKILISYEDICKRYSFVTVEKPNKTPVNISPPLAPETFEHFMLLNVEYDRDSNKALMRFYDPATKKIYFLTDPTGHEPYCLSRHPKRILEKNQQLLNVDGFKRIETVQKMDLLENKVKDFSKLVGTTPLTIASGTSCIKNVIPDVLEANIRYHLNYISDLQLVPGLYYSLKSGKILLDMIPIDESVKKEVDGILKNEKPEYKQFFLEYFSYFVPDVPDFPRVAIDLEIYQSTPEKYPDPGEVKEPIIAASIAASDGRNEVLIWKGHKLYNIGSLNEKMPPNIKVRVFESEAELIRELFRVIWQYPMLITFNGDEFDLRYLYNRAKSKAIGISDEENPISMERGVGLSTHSAFLKYGLHVDLYQFFRNRSIQGYALGGAYSEHSLDAVSLGLLGEKKFEFEGGISELSFLDLVFYNWKDASLTLELTRFKANLVTTLIILLMRICRLPMNEIVRTWVSAWIKQLLIWEHRKRNCVVPNQADIQRELPPADMLKGAFVLNPKPGIYFDVVVMDFSSLYPSIIKEYNLSYETINCKCKNCEKKAIPNTNYKVCGDRIGIMSLITGVIRDLRVLYFKPRAKKNQFYNVLQAALKVLINASYGVYGAETFALYCFPVADATTAIGRYSIQNTVKKATEIGATVLYGDSDSVFMMNPGEERTKVLKEWSERELHLDLDVDKAYKFLALSSRKKNYLGVFKGGGLDIKGLVGKKSNTATFIRDAFFQLTEMINNIKDDADFRAKKEEIKKFIRQYVVKIKNGTLPLEAYEIKITLQGKIVKQITDPNEPTLKIQHLMAARDLHRLKGTMFDSGSVFSYVKVRSGAKAIELASVDEIDREKYMELFKSTFEQVLDALGISFEDIIGI
nr:DNA-directed DNA polymerase I [Candidatus Sigynarchaeota archaeon]